MDTAEFDREMERRFSSIPWRTPLPVSTPGASGLACRLCIAREGLKGSEVEKKTFKSAAQFKKHMEETHGQ